MKTTSQKHRWCSQSPCVHHSLQSVTDDKCAKLQPQANASRGESLGCAVGGICRFAHEVRCCLTVAALAKKADSLRQWA